MKAFQLNWQLVTLFSVALVVVGALVFKGLVPATMLAPLLAWLLPSPFQPQGQEKTVIVTPEAPSQEPKQ